jgi:hypothetical protein
MVQGTMNFLFVCLIYIYICLSCTVQLAKLWLVADDRVCRGVSGKNDAPRSDPGYYLNPGPEITLADPDQTLLMLHSLLIIYHDWTPDLLVATVYKWPRK